MTHPHSHRAGCIPSRSSSPRSRSVSCRPSIPSASSIPCWLFISLLLTSCASSRQVHKESRSSSVSSVSTTDSLSRWISTVSWSASSTDITIHDILFDTSRLDSTGHPLPVRQTTTTIHRQDTAQTILADTTSVISITDASHQSHDDHVTSTHTRSRFIMLSDLACLSCIILLIIIAWKVATRSSDNARAR